MNLELFPIETDNTLRLADEPDYINPYSAVEGWVVSVDISGRCHIIAHPNVHESYFYNGGSCDENGFEELKDAEPGLYKVKYKYWQDHGTYEDPHDIDYGWDIISYESIYEAIYDGEDDDTENL